MDLFQERSTIFSPFPLFCKLSNTKYKVQFINIGHLIFLTKGQPMTSEIPENSNPEMKPIVVTAGQEPLRQQAANPEHFPEGTFPAVLTSGSVLIPSCLCCRSTL